jgi:hypothetical protein
MQLFAKLLKRVHIPEGVPRLLAVLAVGGILSHGAPLFRGIINLGGSVWG